MDKNVSNINIFNSEQLYKVKAINPEFISEHIVNCIIYYLPTYGCYFIPENTFRIEYRKILLDINIVPTLTALRCRTQDWERIEKYITIVPYKINKPNILPEDINIIQF